MTELVEFERWSNDLGQVCRHYEGIARRRQRHVAGRIKVRRFDKLDVADVSGDVQCIRRDYNGIRRDDSEHIFFITQLEGKLNVDHNDRRTSLGKGDSLLLDSTKIGDLGFEETGGRLLSLHMPRQMFLAVCKGSVEIGKRLSLNHPMAQAIQQQMLRFSLGDDNTADVRKASSDLLLNMIQLAFAKDPGMTSVSRWESNDQRFEFAIHLIDNNLTSEKLSLGWLANKMCMSPRQVQRIFQENDTSFAKVMRAKRFRLVAQRISNSKLGEKIRISEVAYSAGFRDLSNFNRGFKFHFGQAPREYIETSSSAHTEIAAKP